jgi:phage host-nuclease inhibitor protein Gam
MATKAKAPAQIYACQSKNETMTAIGELGNVQRDLLRIEAAINDEVAAATAKRQAEIDALKTRQANLTRGIQTWCEANRAELCADGGKTANLVTGEVSWRKRPPSVTVRAADKVISTLKSLGLTQFLRVKEEVNKEAMLAAPAKVSGIAGISIVTDVEDFAVLPFEIEVTA